MSKFYDAALLKNITDAARACLPVNEQTSLQLEYQELFGDKLVSYGPIENQEQLDYALQEINLYFDKEPEIGSVLEYRFEVLANLIEKYEESIGL
jgi:hypothetical protein